MAMPAVARSNTTSRREESGCCVCSCIELVVEGPARGFVGTITRHREAAASDSDRADEFDWRDARMDHGRSDYQDGEVQQYDSIAHRG